MKTRTLKIGLFALLLLNASCGADKNGHKEDPSEPKPPEPRAGDVQEEPETTDTVTTTEPAEKDNKVQIANPASSHCIENGGKLEMMQDKTGGEFAVCIFDDGSRCEEWKFFRKQCKKGDCNDPSGICEKK